MSADETNPVTATGGAKDAKATTEVHTEDAFASTTGMFLSQHASDGKKRKVHTVIVLFPFILKGHWVQFTFR